MFAFEIRKYNQFALEAEGSTVTRDKRSRNLHPSLKDMVRDSRDVKKLYQEFLADDYRIVSAERTDLMKEVHELVDSTMRAIDTGIRFAHESKSSGGLDDNTEIKVIDSRVTLTDTRMEGQFVYDLARSRWRLVDDLPPVFRYRDTTIYELIQHLRREVLPHLLNVIREDIADGVLSTREIIEALPVFVDCLRDVCGLYGHIEAARSSR